MGIVSGDIVVGRVGGYEMALRGAKDAAFEDLWFYSRKRALGANAVVGIDLEHLPTIRGHSTGFYCPVVRSASKCDAGHRMRSATRPRDNRTRPSATFELGGQSGSSAAFRRLPDIPYRAARRACPPHCPNEPL